MSTNYGKIHVIFYYPVDMIITVDMEIKIKKRASKTARYYFFRPGRHIFPC